MDEGMSACEITPVPKSVLIPAQPHQIPPSDKIPDESAALLHLHPADRLRLDLADPLTSDAVLPPDFLECIYGAPVESEAQFQHFLLPLRQGTHKPNGSDTRDFSHGRRTVPRYAGLLSYR